MASKNIGKIYKITCIVNNLSYIGKTIQCVKKRFQQHTSKRSYCRLLLNAINEHRSHNFYVETIWEGDADLLGYMEKKMIKEFNTMSPNGYNLREGGGRSERISDESRKFMISKQREISLSKNGRLGYIKENKSKIDGRITSWTFKARRGGNSLKVANCSTLEEAVKIQEEYTKDPDGYVIPESVYGKGVGEIRGVYYRSDRKKWQARLDNKHIGQYKTEEDANEALKKYKEDPDSFKFIKHEREDKGVTYKKSVEKWMSTSFIDGKNIFLGYYTEKEEAISARKSFIENPESFIRPNQRKKIKL